MVRLNDISEAERAHLLAKDIPRYATTPWVEGPPLAQRRVALVTTAGIHRHGDDPFAIVDLGLPGDPGRHRSR